MRILIKIVASPQAQEIVAAFEEAKWLIIYEFTLSLPVSCRSCRELS